MSETPKPRWMAVDVPPRGPSKNTEGEDDDLRRLAGFVDHGWVGSKKGHGWWVGFQTNVKGAKAFMEWINHRLSITGTMKPVKRKGEPGWHFKVKDAGDALKLLRSVLPYVTRRERVKKTIAECEQEMRFPDV